MRTSEENIRQLLEMLDNPDAYTEQEIMDIIDRDEDTRETYGMMTEAKCSCRHRQHQTPVDVDAAWQRFNQRLRVSDETSIMKLQPEQHDFGWMKMAASFIGLLLVAGIAFAALHIVHQHRRQETPKAEGVVNVAPPVTTAPAYTQADDTTTVSPVIYDNIPLEVMLPEIAAHYDVDVTFQSEEVRKLRFRFVWNPQQNFDQVISNLNQFERLTVTRKDNQITVK